MPSWTLEGFDGILAVRHRRHQHSRWRGGAEPEKVRKTDKAKVWKSELWRHGDEKTKRDEAVDRLIDMLKDLIKAAEKAKSTSRL